MKRFFVNLQLAALLITLFAISGNATAPQAKFDIYPTAWTGAPIAGKVFTVSPAMPNGSTTITSGATYARIFVGGCGTTAGSPNCFNKNVYYTINGGSCFNRLRIKFSTGYIWSNEPSVLFSELYDGNEGFQVSGGSNYLYSLLPRTSQYPCG